MRFLFDVHIETEIAIPNIAAAGSAMRDYILWCINVLKALCNTAGLADAWRHEGVLPEWVLEENDSSLGARLLMLSKHTLRGGLQQFLKRPPAAGADPVTAPSSRSRKWGADEPFFPGGVQSAHDEWPRSCFVLLYHALLPTLTEFFVRHFDVIYLQRGNDSDSDSDLHAVTEDEEVQLLDGDGEAKEPLVSGAGESVESDQVEFHAYKQLGESLKQMLDDLTASPRMTGDKEVAALEQLRERMVDCWRALEQVADYHGPLVDTELIDVGGADDISLASAGNFGSIGIAQGTPDARGLTATPSDNQVKTEAQHLSRQQSTQLVVAAANLAFKDDMRNELQAVSDYIVNLARIQSLPTAKKDTRAARDGVNLPNLLQNLTEHVRRSLLPGGLAHAHERWMSAEAAAVATQVLHLLRDLLQALGTNRQARNKKQTSWLSSLFGSVGARKQASGRRTSVMQEQITLVGGLSLCLDLIADGVPHKVVGAALALGTALLDCEGGNIHGQQLAYAHLSRRGSEHFFKAVQSRLRDAARRLEALRERLHDDAVHRDVDGGAAGGTGAGGGEIRGEAGGVKSGVDGDADLYSRELLGFLQLLSDGHFYSFSLLLLDQPQNGSIVNVPLEMVHYLAACSACLQELRLQPWQHGGEAHVVVGCTKAVIEALEELCQGQSPLPLQNANHAPAGCQLQTNTTARSRDSHTMTPWLRSRPFPSTPHVSVQARARRCKISSRWKRIASRSSTGSCTTCTAALENAQPALHNERRKIIGMKPR